MILFTYRQQSHHKTPHTPTNEERLQAYRAVAPTEIGNGYFVGGRSPVSEYARNETLDGREPAREF